MNEQQTAPMIKLLLIKIKLIHTSNKSNIFWIKLVSDQRNSKVCKLAFL